MPQDVRTPEKRGIAQALGRAYGAIDQFRESQVADPELRAKLTPDYVLGCKRVLFSDDYYAAMTQGHVALEDSALVSVDGSTVTGASGSSCDVDILVLAAGFDAYNPPNGRLIHGADGTSLEDEWADGLRAHQTSEIGGFPNMFVLGGPAAATDHSSVFYTAEAQIDHVLAALDWCAENGITRLDVALVAEAAFAAELHGKAQGTVWLEGGCSSWYLDPRNGKLTSVWPETTMAFRATVETFRPEAYEVLSDLDATPVPA